ncbi:MAG: hypothetical protein ACI4VN_01020 [Clostridia bacterium]
MENASEALKMAGGMLIAVLLIALIVYEFNSVSSLENTKKDEEVLAETTEFNRRFSAFDKSSMYGTDLISVIGLAISNNKIYNQEHYANPLGNYDSNSQYSIDIEFELKTPIYKTTKIEIINLKTGATETQTPKKEQVLTATSHKLSDFSPDELYASYKQYLENKKDNPDALPTGQYKEYKEIEDIALNGDSTVIVKTEYLNINRTKLKRTTTDLTGYNELKNVIFKCTLVKYNDVGRIYYMKFEPTK